MSQKCGKNSKIPPGRLSLISGTKRECVDAGEFGRLQQTMEIGIFTVYSSMERCRQICIEATTNRDNCATPSPECFQPRAVLYHILFQAWYRQGPGINWVSTYSLRQTHRQGNCNSVNQPGRSLILSQCRVHPTSNPHDLDSSTFFSALDRHKSKCHDCGFRWQSTSMKISS
jgi:hypothetical protein